MQENLTPDDLIEFDKFKQELFRIASECGLTNENFICCLLACLGIFCLMSSDPKKDFSNILSCFADFKSRIGEQIEHPDLIKISYQNFLRDAYPNANTCDLIHWIFNGTLPPAGTPS